MNLGGGTREEFEEEREGRTDVDTVFMYEALKRKKF